MITVRVTTDCIRTGIPRSVLSCPVAKGFQKAGVACLVNGRDAVIGGKEIRLPQFVQDFILDYDTGKPVKPFLFEFDLASSH